VIPLTMAGQGWRTMAWVNVLFINCSYPVVKNIYIQDFVMSSQSGNISIYKLPADFSLATCHLNIQFTE
jgi:hypothetical protein